MNGRGNYPVGHGARSLMAEWRREDFYQCRMGILEKPVEFVARMWVRWCEARPFGVDAFDGITFMARHLPPMWSEWATYIGRGFWRVEASSARPIADMPAFVTTLLTTMVAHPEGPPPPSRVSLYTTPLPVPPMDPEGTRTDGYERGESSRPVRAKRARAEDDGRGKQPQGPAETDETYDGGDESERGARDYARSDEEERTPEEEIEDSPKVESEHAEAVETENVGAIPPPIPAAPSAVPPPPPTFVYDPASPFCPSSMPYFYVDFQTHTGYHFATPPSWTPIYSEPPVPTVADIPPAEPASPSIEEIFPDPSGKSHEHPIDIDSASDVED